MTPYSEWAPTGFDSKGAFLHEQGDWLVLRVMRTRDSGPQDESNFRAAEALLAEACKGDGDGDGDSRDSYEVHRFGHWGPGWFEIILVRPGSAAEKAAGEIEARLEDYPILDDEDFSSRELELAARTWEHMNLRDRIDAIQRYGNGNIWAARRDTVPSDDADPSGSLFQYLAQE